jgi:hypothetical protein
MLMDEIETDNDKVNDNEKINQLNNDFEVVLKQNNLKNIILQIC